MTAILWMYYIRINRNIVECKDSTGSKENNLYPVLIETLWNVKQTQLQAQQARQIVLIETLWNVKWFNM